MVISGLLTQLDQSTILSKGKIYSPHQVSHTGANHHHINSLFSHNLIKTHIWIISIATTFLSGHKIILCKYLLIIQKNIEFLNICPDFPVKPSYKQGQNLKPSGLLEAISGKICKLVSRQLPNKNHLILFISHISTSLTETRMKVKIEHSSLAELDRFQSYCGWGGGVQ